MEPTDSDLMDGLSDDEKAFARKLTDIVASMRAQDTPRPSESARGARLTPEAERASDADVEKCGKLVQAEAFAALERHLGKAETVEPTKEGRLFCFFTVDTPVTVNYPAPFDPEDGEARIITFQVKAPLLFLELDADGLPKDDPSANAIYPLVLTKPRKRSEVTPDPNQGRGRRGEIFLDELEDAGGTRSLRRIDVPFTASQLGLFDLLVALAVQDAKQDGDAERANRVWASLYGLELNAEDVASIPAPAPAPRQDLATTTENKRSGRVRTRVLATSDIAHRLPFETEFTEVRTAGNIENDIITRTTVGLPDGLTTGKPINQTGVNVLNSALSHWMAGVAEVSEAKFCKFVYGTTATPSTETLARMAAQVESLMVTPVTVEKTEELRDTGIQIPDGERDYIKTTALHAEIFMRESANGKVSRWYRFIEPPALLMGAAESNQLGSISQVAYERIMDGLRCTDLNVNIANYLIRRCGEMTNSKRHGKKLSPMVSYKTLYRDVTGDDWSELDRHAQKRVRDAVRHVMDGLQAENRFYQWWEYRNTGEGAGKGERLTTTHKAERTFKQGKRNVKRPWFETARKAGCEKKRADGIQIRTAAPSKQRKLTGNGEISK